MITAKEAKRLTAKILAAVEIDFEWIMLEADKRVKDAVLRGLTDALLMVPDRHLEGVRKELKDYRLPIMNPDPPVPMSTRLLISWA